MTLNIDFQEDKRNWDTSFVKEIIEHFVDNNPWVNDWNLMRLDYNSEKYQEPNINAAVDNYTKKNNLIATFLKDDKPEEPKTNFDAKAAFTNLDGEHGLAYQMSDSYFKKDSYNEVLLYWLNFLPRLKELKFCNFFHFAGNEEFCEKHNIEDAMTCDIFTPLWVHILGPSFYEKEITKENLLATPAYKVEELHDGIVMIQTYENPFEYDTPEAIEYMRNVSNHLIENALW